jgi:hypothetical protein
MTMSKKRKNTFVEDPEYGLDSRYNSAREQESEATALMEARLQRMKKLSGAQIVRAKLLQLKLRMEEYLKEPVYDERNYFIEFLKTYIDTIYSKRSTFAHDIDVTPIRLSQVLNNHRVPKDEFMLKLMIHSEKVYKNLCAFQNQIWYHVYFHEKINDTMASQEEWRSKIEKHVKLSNTLKE